VVVHAKSRVLELQYANGESFRVPFELLRVYSPSAEVRGHGPGQETLQTGKREVTITAIEGVGNYALQPTFSDGHSTGLYSWDLLYDIATRQDELWREYLDKLKAAGVHRTVIVTDTIRPDAALMRRNIQEYAKGRTR
jgi:DUF971 family protein